MTTETSMTLKQALFGSWDRTFTFVSTLASVLSLALTTLLWAVPTIPWLFVLRDVLIVTGLAMAVGILIWRLVRREQRLRDGMAKLERQRDALAGQLAAFHQIVHDHRDMLCRCFLSEIPAEPITSDRDKQLFNDICHAVTLKLRRSFIEYFASQDIDIGDDLSITIKLTMAADTIISLYGNKLTPDHKKKIKKKRPWIVTAYRDPTTFVERKKREVGQRVYDPDRNTAFIHIFREHRRYFAEDNLAALGESYLNENAGWKTEYNATIVVPIGFIADNPAHSKIFGVLAVDSVNPNNWTLFKRPGSRDIAGHAADILAHYFLLVGLNQSTKKQAPNPKRRPSGEHEQQERN